MDDVEVIGSAPPPRARGNARPGFGFGLTVVTVASVALSAAASWHVSLWYDEAATISAATRSWPDLLRLVDRTNAAQGVYYAGMHLWSELAGTSALAWRLPSALAVGGTAVGTAVLARTQLSAAGALVAGGVVTVLPRMTWAGIEARPYAFTALVAVWLTVLAVYAVRPRGARATGLWVGYGVLAAVGIGLYVYLALLVLAHGGVVWATRQGRRGRWGWSLAAVGAVVVSAPVWWVAAHQTSQLGIAGRLPLSELVRSLLVTEWFLGDTPTPVAAALRPEATTGFTSLWTAGAIGVAVLGWVLAVIGTFSGARPAEGPADLRWWLLSWLILPVVVIGGYSVLVAPMYVPRYLTFAAPALAILVARGLTIVAQRHYLIAVTTVVLALVLTAPVYVSQRTEFAKNGTDWSALARYLHDHARSGDGVYFGPLRSTSIGSSGGATLRQAEVAYPGDFAGLRDLTLVESAAAAASLVATSRPLAASVAHLDGIDTVWVLRRRDEAPDQVAADDRVLQQAGFTGDLVYQGPMDEIERFVRP